MAERRVKMCALDLGKEVVGRMNLLGEVGDVRDRHLMKAVGQGRVEHLGPGEAAFAEVLSGTHLGNQLPGDGLACFVGGERAQHVGVPGPLLQEL